MENGLINLVNTIPPDRYRHAIICVTESSDFASRIKAQNVAVHELRKRPGKDPGYYYRFWKLLRTLRPAVVHTRNLGTLDLLPVAGLAGVRARIHGEHGWHADDLRGTSKKYWILRRLCDLAVDEYVAVSQDMASWMIHEIGVRPERVRQIYNGVDTTTFCPKGEVGQLPSEIFSADSIVAGAVGRMDPIKNYQWLVGVVAGLLRHSPQHRKKFRLLIAGDGPEIGNIRSAVDAADLGKIVYFTGQRDDMAELYRSMHFLLMPSLNEGISNTILEAMASGIPVISADVGGNPELVVHGRTGALLPVNDRSAFTDAILRYLDDPDLCKLHGRNARERAVYRFSLHSMVQQYTELYDGQFAAHEQSEVH